MLQRVANGCREQQMCGGDGGRGRLPHTAGGMPTQPSLASLWIAVGLKLCTGHRKGTQGAAEGAHRRVFLNGPRKAEAGSSRVSSLKSWLGREIARKGPREELPTVANSGLNDGVKPAQNQTQLALSSGEISPGETPESVPQMIVCTANGGLG